MLRTSSSHSSKLRNNTQEYASAVRQTSRHLSETCHTRVAWGVNGCQYNIAPQASHVHAQGVYLQEEEGAHADRQLLGHIHLPQRHLQQLHLSPQWRRDINVGVCMSRVKGQAGRKATSWHSVLWVSYKRRVHTYIVSPTILCLMTCKSMPPTKAASAAMTAVGQCG